MFARMIRAKGVFSSLDGSGQRARVCLYGERAQLPVNGSASNAVSGTNLVRPGSLICAS